MNHCIHPGRLHDPGTGFRFIRVARRPPLKPAKRRIIISPNTLSTEQMKQLLLNIIFVSIRSAFVFPSSRFLMKKFNERDVISLTAHSKAVLSPLPNKVNEHNNFFYL
jgi:hypothetical protein